MHCELDWTGLVVAILLAHGKERLQQNGVNRLPRSAAFLGRTRTFLFFDGCTTFAKKETRDDGSRIFSRETGQKTAKKIYVKNLFEVESPA
jgi:hypothetical protein